jgi:hypothetical protein
MPKEIRAELGQRSKSASCVKKSVRTGRTPSNSA